MVLSRRSQHCTFCPAHGLQSTLERTAAKACTQLGYLDERTCLLGCMHIVGFLNKVLRFWLGDVLCKELRSLVAVCIFCTMIALLSVALRQVAAILESVLISYFP